MVTWCITWHNVIGLESRKRGWKNDIKIHIYYYDLKILEWVKKRNLILGLVQENSMEFLVQIHLPYIYKATSLLSQIRYSLVVILELNSVSKVQYKDMIIDRWWKVSTGIIDVVKSEV